MKRTQDDPDARLALVLMRYLRGWWEQAKLAAAARFLPSERRPGRPEALC